MSISLSNADLYIASVYGGRGDSNVKARCREALAAAMEDLQHRNDWSFLLTDTSETFTVASCTGAGTTMTTATANGFASVLVGMTVTGTGVPASTTVTAVGSTTSITTSAATTISNATATFGGTIPIQAGTASYTLPTRFWKPYSCRFTSSMKHPLRYITPRELDLQTYDQTTQGVVWRYTLYNPTLFDSNGTQQAKIKFHPVPAAADVALLKYYRPFDASDDPVDIPDEYLYTLLDFARVKLLETKNAVDERLPYLRTDIERRIAKMIAKDRNEGGEDEYERFHTPDEASGPWRGDPFYPRGDYGH